MEAFSSPSSAINLGPSLGAGSPNSGQNSFGMILPPSFCRPSPSSRTPWGAAWGAPAAKGAAGRCRAEPSRAVPSRAEDRVRPPLHCGWSRRLPGRGGRPRDAAEGAAPCPRKAAGAAGGTEGRGASAPPREGGREKGREAPAALSRPRERSGECGQGWEGEQGWGGMGLGWGAAARCGAASHLHRAGAGGRKGKEPGVGSVWDQRRVLLLVLLLLRVAARDFCSAEFEVTI